LGAATVRKLVGGGANVVIADLNKEVGEALEAEVGVSARFVRTDVTDEGSVRAAVAAAREMGDLRGAINCAGVAHAEKVLGRGGTHSLDSFAKVVGVNLIGTFNVSRLAAFAMKDNSPSESGERGVIVNTASVAAFEGQVGQAAYSASKGGVVSMTLPLARELARFGIRVVSVAPGIFDTPMMTGLPEAARESLSKQVPFPPRLGHPDEYAALVEHILSNTMLNGEVIRLDGAVRMAAR
jgi:NAD(P)-dependent dehydrogenase (short-subunit alcohol dehydrogenase family)